MTPSEIISQALLALDEFSAIPALRGPELEALEHQLEDPEMTPLKALVLSVYGQGLEAACAEISAKIGVEVRPPKIRESADCADYADKEGAE